MKQKRLQSGMIQASDLRSTSGKIRQNSGSKRELHGRIGSHIKWSVFLVLFWGFRV